MPAMYCGAPTTVTALRFGHESGTEVTSVGTATLASGERIVFYMGKIDGGFVLHMHKGMNVQVCYGPGDKPQEVLLGDLTSGATAYGYVLPATSPVPTP
jgi:hypothetical protein